MPIEIKEIVVKVSVAKGQDSSDSFVFSGREGVSYTATDDLEGYTSTDEIKGYTATDDLWAGYMAKDDFLSVQFAGYTATDDLF